MNKPFIISCAGFSRSGKSTFCNLISKELKNRFNLKVCQFSFAHQLRLDTQEFLKKCGFDVWSDVNKEQFRPVLVWYANLMRRQTKGQYFIEKLKQNLELTSKDGYYDVFLISDLRFAEYSPNDEIDYCLNMGPVVHISRYKLVPPDPTKNFDTSPNEFEAKNDPLIRGRANYIIEWENENGRIENLKPYIIKLVNWLSEKYL